LDVQEIKLNIKEFKIVEKEFPYNKTTWVEILVKIRNNNTGEIRDYLTTGIWDEEENCLALYIWKEGNFSCDCNRAIFFKDSDETCGDTRYSCNIINPVSNEIIYQEYSTFKDNKTYLN
jgi:hypothetical protein